MSITSDEMPEVSRPLGSAEQRDIASHTARLLDHFKKYTSESFDRLTGFNRKATIELIYIGFGFKLMREEFRNDHAWKKFLKENFPKEISKAKDYVTIGRHFHYDDSYLEFLHGCDYGVPPKELAQKRNIGSQLDDLRRQGVDITSPWDLMDLIRRGFLPEVGVKKPAPQPETTTDVSDVSSPSGESPELDVEASEKPESQAESDEEEIICDRLLTTLISNLSPLVRAQRVFNSLIARRPLAQLNPTKVALLKEAVRPAVEIFSQL
jgi:hypothetical protein